MTVLELSVPGMGCRRRVREVTARLRDVPGVETVTVDAARSRVTLTGTMTRADVLAALSGSAYRARRHAVPPIHAPDAADTAAALPSRSGETDTEQQAHR